MSKADYRKKIIDLRSRLARVKAEKKKDNESYARLIKGTSSVSSKASYRKRKIDRAAYHDREIASIKRSILSAQSAMKKCSK